MTFVVNTQWSHKHIEIVFTKSNMDNSLFKKIYVTKFKISVYNIVLQSIFLDRTLCHVWILMIWLHNEVYFGVFVVLPKIIVLENIQMIVCSPICDMSHAGFSQSKFKCSVRYSRLPGRQLRRKPQWGDQKMENTSLWMAQNSTISRVYLLKFLCRGGCRQDQTCV